MVSMREGKEFFRKTNKPLTEIEGCNFDQWHLEDNDIISQFEYNQHECHLTKKELYDLCSENKEASDNIIDAFVDITKRAIQMKKCNKSICLCDDKWYIFPPCYNYIICPILDEDNEDSVLNLYHTFNSTLETEKEQFIKKMQNMVSKNNENGSF